MTDLDAIRERHTASLGELICQFDGQSWPCDAAQLRAALDAQPVGVGPSRGDVDRMARVLIAAWEKAEGPLVGTSYIATFADMARAALASTPRRTADEALRRAR